MTVGPRITEDQEREGLDFSLHGERVEQRPAAARELIQGASPADRG
jgi:hypothetical protein